MPTRLGEPWAGEALLFLILAFAICKISIRRELRSPAVPEPSDQIDEPEMLEPEISDPDSSQAPTSSPMGDGMP